LFTGGLARRSTPGFLFSVRNVFERSAKARDALGGTQGRGSLTTEEAGKYAEHFAPISVGKKCEAFLVRKFCSRERIVERKKANYPHGTPRKSKSRRRRAG
jgi:hypothetical protein